VGIMGIVGIVVQGIVVQSEGCIGNWSSCGAGYDGECNDQRSGQATSIPRYWCNMLVS